MDIVALMTVLGLGSLVATPVLLHRHTSKLRKKREQEKKSKEIVTFGPTENTSKDKSGDVEENRLKDIIDFVINDKASQKGEIGEKHVIGLLNKLPQDQYIVLNNLTMKNEQGNFTQIDHVVISMYGVFVIETKNYNGAIYGNADKSKELKQYLKGGTFSMYNPVWQNFSHMSAVKAATGLTNYVNSIVCFTDTAKLKIISSQADVINARHLIATITERKQVIWSYDEVLEYAKAIKLASDSSVKAKKQHLRRVKELQMQ